MINLNIVPEKDQSTLFQEGILDTSLKNAADIDTGKIKEEWQNADKGIYDKAKTLNDEGLQKGRDQADAIDRVLKKTTVDTRSIIARARNSVLQFPIYVPQTIRVNEAHIIGKMFERVYTTLVQTVLSQNPIMDEEEANNLVFLKQFHTNLREAADFFVNKYYEPIDEIDRMLCESVYLTQKISENCTVEFKAIPCQNQDLILENARLMNEPLTGFMYLQEALNAKEKAETEDTIKTAGKATVLSDKDLQEIAADRDSKIDRKTVKLASKSNEEIRKEVKAEYDDSSNKDDIQAEVVKKIKERDSAVEIIDKAVDDLKSDIKLMQYSSSQLQKMVEDDKLDKEDLNRIERMRSTYGDISYKNGQIRRQDNTKELTRKPKEHREKPIQKAPDPPRLNKDSEIKKLNGMLPYTFEASFHVRTKNGIDREVRYVIGVKSVMHPFRTQDLADDLRELVTGNIQTLQKVRYNTGEIGFKDYFFNIKGLKADAAKHVNYDKRWLNTLKRLGEYKKLNGTLMKKSVESITGGNVPIPNGTMVLAQTDVTTIVDQTGIDLSVVSNAKRLARSLFLIGVVIVDSTRGTMRVLFPDSDNEWDVQSLAAIDSELSKTDNSQLMKELNQMVNR